MWTLTSDKMSSFDDGQDKFTQSRKYRLPAWLQGTLLESIHDSSSTALLANAGIARALSSTITPTSTGTKLSLDSQRVKPTGEHP